MCGGRPRSRRNLTAPGSATWFLARLCVGCYVVVLITSVDRSREIIY